MSETEFEQPANTPVFNVPAIVVVFIAVLVIIHCLRVWLFTPETLQQIILLYSFIPARYSDIRFEELSPLALYWSPLSYSFLHGDWTHLIVNSLWMLVFGGVVARRVGVAGFVVLFVLGSIGGAIAHYLAYPGEVAPVIGVSASVSAFMGAAVRFAFPRYRRFSMDVAMLPTQPLPRVFSNPQAMTFLAVWFAINLLFGIGASALLVDGASIAWQAHIGGFVAGLIAFPLLDRHKPEILE